VIILSGHLLNIEIFDIPSRLNHLRQKSECIVNNEGTNSLSIAPYQATSGEHYMNERQLAHIEKILLAWRQSLMEEVDRTVTHMKDEAANFPDPSDRASQEEEFSIELRTRDRERKLIKKIEDALERLHEDDFGYCEACGVEIGMRRLEARPTATLCIDCKTLAEIKERQNQGN
jgi:DnaK suppressor protein